MLQCKLTAEEREDEDRRAMMAHVAAGVAWTHDPLTRDQLSPYITLVGCDEFESCGCRPPKLWMDAQGVLHAGLADEDGRVDPWEELPVREVLHVRTHPLVVVVTDLDIFVMSVEEYARQV